MLPELFNDLCPIATMIIGYMVNNNRIKTLSRKNNNLVRITNANLKNTNLVIFHIFCGLCSLLRHITWSNLNIKFIYIFSYCSLAFLSVWHLQNLDIVLMLRLNVYLKDRIRTCTYINGHVHMIRFQIRYTSYRYV